jgi:hypothetical protein
MTNGAVGIRDMRFVADMEVQRTPPHRFCTATDTTIALSALRYVDGSLIGATETSRNPKAAVKVGREMALGHFLCVFHEAVACR